MYPSKGHLLISKWENFKIKISKYYENNIHNDYCRQLLSSATSTTNIGLYIHIHKLEIWITQLNYRFNIFCIIDAQDYLYIILLNAVIPSPARFKNVSGKRNKKLTIADAQESLVLRLATINDYKRQIDGVINKYYSIGLTVQPFIIVEGFSEVDIKGYYIYFDNTLLKLNSFIESQS